MVKDTGAPSTVMWFGGFVSFWWTAQLLAAIALPQNSTAAILRVPARLVYAIVMGAMNAPFHRPTDIRNISG